MANLTIFTEGEEKPIAWPVDAESQASLALDVLDHIQTVVDVLVDEGVSYEVAFGGTDAAFTEHKSRRIVISVKPLTEGGKPFDDVVAIQTGFAVHEIGHTKERERELGRLIKAEWPGKVMPHRLGNILSDVRLEATAVARWPGLTGVFHPTLVWVAEKTCPTHVLTYGKTKHDRLNFAGQAVRYEPFVQFAQDTATQAELVWWKEWGNVSAETTNEDMLERVRQGLDRIKAGAEYEPAPEDENGGPSKDGDPTQSPNADADETTEGENGEESSGEDGEQGEDGETEGEGNGESEESDTEGEGEGSPTDAPDMGDESKGEGKGESEDGEDATKGGDDDSEDGGTDGTEGDSVPDHVLDGQLDEGETLDRTHTDAPMGDGAGGSGKAIADAADVDEGLDKDKLTKTQDELTQTNPDDPASRVEKYQNDRLQNGVEEERQTTRFDAGAFGKMKVKVNL